MRSKYLASLRLIVLAVGFLLAPGSNAHACSCVSGGPCGAFHRLDTMFAGKALSVRTADPNAAKGFPYRHRIYRFEVSEVIAGSVKAREIVEVETGMGGGDCGYNFQIGESYLVDASSHGQSVPLATSICTDTRGLAAATNLLREIRIALSHGRQPDLSGTIWAGDDWQSAFSNPRPLSGIRVQLTPVSGNAYSTISDSDGIYTFQSVPPGVYQIDFSLPSNRVSSSTANGQLRSIEIPPSGGTGAACHRDEAALPAGRIEGQIIDASGKGASVSGIVSLRKPGQLKDSPYSSFIQSRDGRFTIDFVPAGTYRVVFRQYAPNRETWMAADAERPDGLVTLKDAEQVAGLQIVVK